MSCQGMDSPQIPHREAELPRCLHLRRAGPMEAIPVGVPPRQLSRSLINPMPVSRLLLWCHRRKSSFNGLEGNCNLRRPWSRCHSWRFSKFSRTRKMNNQICPPGLQPGSPQLRPISIIPEDLLPSLSTHAMIPGIERLGLLACGRSKPRGGPLQQTQREEGVIPFSVATLSHKSTSDPLPSS